MEDNVTNRGAALGLAKVPENIATEIIQITKDILPYVS